MALTVGVPRERKDGEHRVAITPDGAHELRALGVTVVVEAGAGVGSSFADDDYAAAGAEVVHGADTVWSRAQLVLKVKEPQPAELDLLRPGLVLFTYLHLAAYPAVADALLARGVTAIGYETVQLASGALPLLAPMSEVAGRMATQIGAHFLERDHGGRGVLLGGAPGVRPARVVVVGAGNVGWNAAWIAQGMEAEVLLLDKDLDRLRFVDQIHRGRIMTLASTRAAVERAVRDAAVQGMRPGAVIVDCAIDQGGSVEGIHETTHAAPVFERHGVLHYAVGNIPAAVPHTSTYALTNATLPYVVALASAGVGGAVAADPSLAAGVNTVAGEVTNPAVAAALGRPVADLPSVLASLDHRMDG